MFGTWLVNELGLATSLLPPELGQGHVDPPQGHADHQIVAQRDDVRELQHVAQGAKFTDESTPDGVRVISADADRIHTGNDAKDYHR